VTWANAAPNVRFAALSAISVTNSSPFGVHVVDFYVYNPGTNSLVAHYYINSTEDFDYWVGQGSSMTIPVRFIWSAATSYLVTLGTDTGVTAQTTASSPPLSSTSCSAGSFVSTTGGTTVCTNTVFHVDADIGLSTSTPTIVQNTITTFTSGTSTTLAFGSNLGAKDTVIVCEGDQGITTLPGAPTDSLSLTYTSIASSNTVGSNSAIQCWEAMSSGGGADTVTTGTYNGGIACTSSAVCQVDIWELSGTDIVLLASTTGGSSTATTSPTMTSISYSNTPLLIGVYQEAAAGPDTAATGCGGFTLANGETGSLSYLTMKQTSPTASSSCTFSGGTMFGTSSAYNGIGIVAISATAAFSISLSSNTNYVFQVDMSVGAPTGTAQAIYLHQMDTGVTLQTVCIVTVQASINNACFTSTDTNLYANPPSAAESQTLFGTIKVGSKPTTLLIEFGCTTSATNNAATLKAGSFIIVTPTQ
jgi:hypothetical protein